MDSPWPEAGAWTNDSSNSLLVLIPSRSFGQ